MKARARQFVVALRTGNVRERLTLTEWRKANRDVASRGALRKMRSGEIAVMGGGAEPVVWLWIETAEVASYAVQGV